MNYHDVNYQDGAVCPAHRQQEHNPATFCCQATRRYINKPLHYWIVQGVKTDRYPWPNVNERTSSPLTGSYNSGDDVVIVRELDSRLEITKSHWGSYFLLPRTGTEFVAQDAHRRIEFELDVTGSAAAIQI